MFLHRVASLVARRWWQDENDDWSQKGLRHRLGKVKAVLAVCWVSNSKAMVNKQRFRTKLTKMH